MARIEVDQEKITELNDHLDRIRDREIPFMVHPAERMMKMFEGMFSRKKNPEESYPGFLSGYKQFGNMMNRPIIDTEFGKLGTIFFSFQSGRWPSHCRIMERDYYRCAVRVGLQNEDRFCRLYREDVWECARQLKTMKRRLYMARMREEKNMKPVESPPKHLHYSDFIK